jgi:sugar lactone lactonase YvrE
MKTFLSIRNCLILFLLGVAFAVPAARADIFLVSLNTANSVEEFSANGTDLGPFANFTTGNLTQPQGLALDASGNLYVSNALGNTVQKFTLAGVNLGVFASENLNNPQQLVFDGSGNLYVPNYFGASVQKYSAAGNFSGQLKLGTAGWSAVFDASGNLYVSEPSANRVEEFSSGFDLGPFVSGGNLSRPLGLIFDPSGNLLVANNNSNQIEKYSPTGTDLGNLGIANLSQPTGMTYDSAGNLYVCSSGNNQIHEISANGTDLGVFANTGTDSSPASIIAIASPNLTTSPTDQTVLQGDSTTFTSAASGIVLQYQWQFNGANLTDGGNISGSNTTTLQISNTTPDDDGNYTVVVTNIAGLATATAVLTVTPVIPPMIDQRPHVTSHSYTDSVTISVEASGTDLTYEWQLNGANLTDGDGISGANSPTLTISDPTSSDAGNYTVVVSNSNGSVTSSAAPLTVQKTGVTIGTPKAKESIILTASTKFKNSSSVTYQWLRNGNPVKNTGTRIKGATTPKLTIQPAIQADSGTYALRVTNSVGITTGPGLVIIVP